MACEEFKGYNSIVRVIVVRPGAKWNELLFWIRSGQGDFFVHSRKYFVQINQYFVHSRSIRSGRSQFLAVRSI